MRRDRWLHAATFVVCVGIGVLVPISVGAYREWREISAKRQVPADRGCVGVSEANLPPALPAGTPFASVDEARRFLGTNAAPLRLAKDALGRELRGPHDRLVACAGVDGVEHRRLRLLARWHLRIQDGTIEASGFRLDSILGQAGPDQDRARRCFEQAFQGSVVATAPLPGAFRFEGTYPVPLIVDL